MRYEDVKQLVMNTAIELAQQGSGWAQESLVLREVADRLQQSSTVDLRLQQLILSAWHDLFRERKLSWGYDLDNPNWPFFHVPDEVTAESPVSAAVG